MTGTVILAVEIPRIPPIDAMHNLDEVPLHGLHDQMVVVAHEHETMDEDAMPFMIILQNLEKLFPVGIVPKYLPPLIATAGDMVQCPRILDSYRPTHIQSLSQADNTVNCLGLTP
jgi:hypothetical protein